ncbi:autophagy-related protein 16 [Terfezia claveryi]|nr:autophagy-related protein 16 [Terfezia claveryi]
MAETWKDSILASLTERDKREKSQLDIITAYTRLASRTSFLESKVQALQLNRPFGAPHSTICSQTQIPNPKETTTPSDSSPQTNLPHAPGTPPSIPTPLGLEPTNPVLLQLKSDLTIAQRTKTLLTTDLNALKAQYTELIASHSSCKQQIAELIEERNTFSRKLATREEEMQYKNKQVERLQDDIIALEMQLNVLHDQKDKLQGEYNDLVKRMMKYKEREAEELINNSKYS